MIREMKKDDLPIIKSLMQSIPYFWHDCWSDTTLEKAFDFSGSLTFVYEIENTIVGCIFAYDFGFRGYIAKLAVNKEKRLKGIGKKLTEHVENILKENGCELVIADVSKSAEQFYRRLGWSEPMATLLRKRLI